MNIEQLTGQAAERSALSRQFFELAPHAITTPWFGEGDNRRQIFDHAVEPHTEEIRAKQIILNQRVLDICKFLDRDDIYTNCRITPKTKLLIGDKEEEIDIDVSVECGRAFGSFGGIVRGVTAVDAPQGRAARLTTIAIPNFTRDQLHRGIFGWNSELASDRDWQALAKSVLDPHNSPPFDSSNLHFVGHNWPLVKEEHHFRPIDQLFNVLSGRAEQHRKIGDMRCPETPAQLAESSEIVAEQAKAELEQEIEAAHGTHMLLVENLK